MISECDCYLQLLSKPCLIRANYNVSRQKSFNFLFVRILCFFHKVKIHFFSGKIGFFTNIQYSLTLSVLSKTLKHVKGEILSEIQKFCQTFFSRIFWIPKINVKKKWNPNICRRKFSTKFLKSPYQKTLMYKISEFMSMK